jgi:membrane protease YdiL (CAAX protease family)
MRGRSLLLLCAVSILLIILVAFFNLSNLAGPIVEGSRDAYFTNVKHGTTAYEGKNFTWSLTTFNKNCSTDSEGRALFYFLFYLDGDLWWSEYNNTEYQTWPCKRGNSVTRSFSVPTWYSVKPAIHNLKIELYWSDGNASRLQDGVSFPVSVAVHVDRDNLVIYSYLVICLGAVFILGFYMTTTGPLPSAISTEPQDPTSVSGKQIGRMISSLPKAGWHLFLSFYFFVFASWQTINILLREFSISEQVFPYLFLAVQIVYLGVLALLIGRENSTFARYGFVWPEETGKYVAAVLLFAFSYIFVASILPGIFGGYTVFPTLSFTEVFSLVLSTLVASFASEAIFRGYLQTKLTELSGFPLALLATSLMFSLYALPFLPFDPSLVFFQILSLFVLGLFLGVLYYRTKTLLCPIVFYSAILIINGLLSVEALASEYSKFLLQLSAIGLSSLLLFVLTLKTGRETLDEEIVCEHALS